MNQAIHPGSDIHALRDPDQRSAIPAGDYVSTNLEVVLPDFAFPHMVKGNLAISTWPYLRKEVPHNWYVDSRNPSVGFVSRDEAAILYNTAKRFAGSPCLEIGCWRGWSTVHLALGAGTLDVVDPALSEPPFLDDVHAACVRVGVGDAVSFHAGFSPEAVDSLAQRAAKRWSLIFIDGNHEDDAPYKDAQVVALHAADDAMVLFHDLVSPAVARGLDYFRSLGWKTRLYQTMQIMGVAWRGNVRPVDHLPDPSVTWSVPRHLTDYEIGTPGCEEIHKPYDQLRRERDSAWARATRAELDFASLSARIAPLSEHAQTLAAVTAELVDARALIAALQARLERAECLEQDFVDLTKRMVSVSRAAAEVVTLKGQLEAAQLENDALGSRVRSADHRVNEVHRQLHAEQSARVIQVDVLMKHITAMAAHSEMFARNEAAAQAHRSAAIEALSVWFTQTRVLLGLLRRPGSERIVIVTREAAARGMESLISPAMGHLLCRRRMLIGLLHHRRPSRPALVAGMVREADRNAAPEARAIQASEGPPGLALSLTPLEDLMRDHHTLQTRFQALENAKLDDEASLLDARTEIAALRVAIRRRTAENVAHG